MKSGFPLFISLLTLLSSCDWGRPHMDLPGNFPDTTSPVAKDPYTPDSICLFPREKTGNIIGEWLEVGTVEGCIISEIDCANIDTIDLASSWERRWVFVNDSVVETYGQDVVIKNDGAEIIVSGREGQSWMYEMRGINDTILMTDDEHRYLDTLRITCLDEQTLILASVRHKWAFRPPEVKSVVYVRKK